MSFLRYGICTEGQPTIRRFILGHFQQKLMTQFSVKAPKPYFCPFWALFALNLENENFPRYGISAESQPTIIRFILGHFQQKLMIQFCVKVIFGPFWAFLPIYEKMRIFPKNPALSLFYVYGPLTSCKKQKKLMNQS